MKIIEFLRKPYLSMVMAMLVLFVSCEQYDTIEEEKVNKFDYSLYQKYKKSLIFDEIKMAINDAKNQLEKTSKTIVERNREVLNIVNSRMKYKLDLPDAALKLTELSSDEILYKSLENKWMTLEDVTLIKSFLLDFKNNGIDLAISNYESKVLKMKINKVEFNKKNLFINTVMVLKYKNPDAFYKDFEINKAILSKSSTEDDGVLGCILATIAFIGAIGGISACATVVLCGLALFGVGYTFNNWMNKCVGQHSVM